MFIKMEFRQAMNILITLLDSINNETMTNIKDIEKAISSLTSAMVSSCTNTDEVAHNISLYFGSVVDMENSIYFSDLQKYFGLAILGEQ